MSDQPSDIVFQFSNNLGPGTKNSVPFDSKEMFDLFNIVNNGTYYIGIAPIKSIMRFIQGAADLLFHELLLNNLLSMIYSKSYGS